jgi:hypothetical protein
MQETKQRSWEQWQIEERERYDSLSTAEKIDVLDEEANGMGWYYDTNKEREFTCMQLLTRDAINHYITHLKKQKEPALRLLILTIGKSNLKN